MDVVQPTVCIYIYIYTEPGPRVRHEYSSDVLIPPSVTLVWCARYDLLSD